MFFLANEKKIGPECVRGKAAFENRQYTAKNFRAASQWLNAECAFIAKWDDTTRKGFASIRRSESFTDGAGAKSEMPEPSITGKIDMLSELAASMGLDIICSAQTD